MVPPKYQGDEEDWFDNEESQGRRRERGPTRKNKVNEKKSLRLDETNAVVEEVFPNLCRVRFDQPSDFDHRDSDLCSYRRAYFVGNKITDVRERSPVCVGDRVLVSPEKTVEGVATRRNSLSRKTPGREGLHVLVSNVDRLVIVSACKNPDFNIGIIDRFLVAARSQGIECVLVITKADLLPEIMTDSIQKFPWSLYQEIGIKTYLISAKGKTEASLQYFQAQENQNILQQLKKDLEKGRTVFCGHSGVGKTSLISTLMDREVGRVGEVNETTGKGKHTTTSAVMLEGTEWIDTPGVREFQLVGIKPEQVKFLFPEMAGLNCQAPGCIHLGEEGCDAERLDRYVSYRHLAESLVS